MADLLGTAVAAAATNVNHTLTAGTLGDRKAYVGLIYEYNSGGTPPAPTAWTYGGVAVTPLLTVGYDAGGGSFVQATRLGYVLETDLPADGVNSAVCTLNTDSAPQGFRIFAWTVEGVAQVAGTTYSDTDASDTLTFTYDADADAVGSALMCANGQTFSFNASWVEFGDGGGTGGDASGAGATKAFASPVTGETLTVTLSAAARTSGIVVIDEAAGGGGGTGATGGTMASGTTEQDIRDGGKVLTLTMTGDTFVASGATFDAQRQAIIDGLDAATSPAGGWNDEVRDALAVTAVARTSDTVVTITFPAFASYSISATETITATIPGAALTGATPIVASPTFTVVRGADDLVQPVGTTNGSGIPSTSSGSLTSDAVGLTRLVATVDGVALNQVVVITKR